MMKFVLYWVLAGIYLSSTHAASILDLSEENDEQKEYAQDEVDKRWLAFAKEGDQSSADELYEQYSIDVIQVKDEDGNNALHLACLYSGNVGMVTWLLDECEIPIEIKGAAQKTPFLCAVQKGQFSIAKLLKQRDADVNARNEYGNNSLHYACFYSGSKEMATWLLDECKISIDAKGQYQMTPFLCAAYEGQLDIAKLLRGRGANVNAKNKYGDNALHYVCLFSGSVEMITWLLDECKLGIESKGRYQKTPFLYAANKGELPIAKLLKRRGANINAKNMYGNNALHLGCFFSGSAEMITWLLDVCKIDIETKGRNQITPFLCAAEKGQLKIAQLLKERGATINAKNTHENNALHLACLYSGSEAMVTWLLDVCNLDLEIKGQYQKSPFLCTAATGQLSVAKLLKQRGADINARDVYGTNTLHYACYFSGNVAMVTWLLDTCEIGLETEGQDKKTPFLCAAQKGQLAVAKFLQRRGADINAKDTHGNNALHLACRYSRNIAMVTWLLDECKIGVDTRGRYQITPFLFAVGEGQLGIAKLLKQLGANVKKRDKDRNNALHYACRYSESIGLINWLLSVCELSIDAKGLYKKTPFLCAAEKGQLNIAKLLRQRGANIYTKDEHGNNALHSACRYSGSANMISWLLDVCKLDLESQGRNQQTPFLFASEKGQLNIAKLLKRRHAAIAKENVYGDNALHLACRYSGNVAMVTWLLDICKLGLETKGYHEKPPFLCAAEKGQLAIAKLLKQRGANVKVKDEYGNSALHLTCLFSGSVEMATWLLDTCNLSLETKGQDKKTPFLCAAEKGQLGIAKLLKQRETNIKARNKYRNNALHLACLFSKSVAMVTWLLDDCRKGIEKKGRDGKTPFLCAAEKGQLDVAKLLKKRWANIGAESDQGNNALHLACLYSGSEAMVTWLLDVCKIKKETKEQDKMTPFLCAVQEGQLRIAKLLKQRGANVKAKDAYRNNALHYACAFSGSQAMVAWLLDICKLGIETKGQDKITPFLCATNKRQLGIAKLLKQRGANINAKSEDGDNALHLVCFDSESIPMINWLLNECKISLESKGRYERTPFLCASGEGQLALTELLKERGAAIKAKDKDGDNALHYACLYSGSVAMVTWLLDTCKISVETRGQDKKTPFLSAAAKGQLGIAKLLKQRGANINAKGVYRNNALHYACLYSGSVPMVNWLLDTCKINLETRGQDKITPFLCAAAKGQLSIAKLLRQRGANIKAKDKDENSALDLALSYENDHETIEWLQTI